MRTTVAAMAGIGWNYRLAIAATLALSAGAISILLFVVWA